MFDVKGLLFFFSLKEGTIFGQGVGWGLLWRQTLESIVCRSRPSPGTPAPGGPFVAPVSVSRLVS